MRLLTRKGTNPPRSKGMAFVEVEDAESAYQCLGLHHSRLDGRLLNVERTSGGGKVRGGTSKRALHFWSTVGKGKAGTTLCVTMCYLISHRDRDQEHKIRSQHAVPLQHAVPVVRAVPSEVHTRSSSAPCEFLPSHANSSRTTTAPPGKEGRAHPGEEGGAEGVHEERGAARAGGVHHRRPAGQDGTRRGRSGGPREDGGEGGDRRKEVDFLVFCNTPP